MIYLILVWPEGADSQLCPEPLFPRVARHVPDGVGQGAFVDLDQDVERAGTGAVLAVQQVVEVDAVGVVLLHDRQLETSLLSCIVLGRVHHHVGT